jgi:hypothetical protein
MKLFQETLIGVFGEEHPDTLQTIFGMATCLHEIGTCVEAESLYIKAWHGWERILGQNHPDTVNCDPDTMTRSKYLSSPETTFLPFRSFQGSIDSTQRRRC